MMEQQQQRNKANSDTPKRRKRNRPHEGLDDALSPSTGINDLPDDILISILSRLSGNEAARTSVLARRWRYLWVFSSGTLVFDNAAMFSPDDKAVLFSPGPTLIDDRLFSARIGNLRKEFVARVNRALKSHRALNLDGLVIRLTHLRSRYQRPGYVTRWLYFAMRKEVKMLELNFSMHGGDFSFYKFPTVDSLRSRSRDAKFGFGSLRSLRLVDVDIGDKVVEYFLASCPYLEELCIRASWGTKNLRVVGRLPNLKVLEVSDCKRIQKLEVSAVNLVSCTYQGNEMIVFPIKETPNLSELTLGGDFAWSFINETNKLSSYSVQLVKLTLNVQIAFPVIFRPADLPLLYSLKHLELNVGSPVSGNINIFISLIMAAPLLNEFRIKIIYAVASKWTQDLRHETPDGYRELMEHCHKNLKTVHMSGYVGSSCDDLFLMMLSVVAPSLETVTVDTESDYYKREPWAPANRWDPRREIGARTRMEAKERVGKLKPYFHPIELIVT